MAEDTKPAEQGPAYQIGTRTYPFPTRFLLGDPVLVRELTGLEWADFVDRLPDEDAPPDQLPDPIAELGLIGCAIWHQHPTWRRDKVVRYVLALGQDDIKFIGPVAEEDVPEGDAGPPDEHQATATEEPTSDGLSPSETPAPSSDSGAALTSAPPSQQPSGPPATPAGAQD